MGFVNDMDNQTRSEICAKDEWEILWMITCSAHESEFDLRGHRSIKPDDHAMFFAAIRCLDISPAINTATDNYISRYCPDCEHKDCSTYYHGKCLRTHSACRKPNGRCLSPPYDGNGVEL